MRSFKKGLLLALLPTFEFILLRIYLRQNLGLRFGFVPLTEVDWIFCGGTAFLFLVVCLERSKKLALKLNKFELIIHLVLLLMAFFFPYFFKELFLPWGALVIALTLFSAFFVFSSYKQIFSHPERKLILPAVLLGMSQWISRDLFFFLWEPTRKMTSFLACGLFNHTVPHFTCNTFKNEFTHLNFPSFTFSLGVGCAGLEGVTFFLFVMGLFWMHDSKKITKRLPVFLILGVPLMYFLNLVRIALTALLFSLLSLLPGLSLAQRSYLNNFLHHSVGWLIWLLAIGVITHLLFKSELKEFKINRIPYLTLKNQLRESYSTKI